ncbi:MAG TPA: MarR family transcriptional regulator [Anaerolineales bacterium]|nr:MarR family transcriptional regulator [Anaerolineales bacterium]
MTKAATLSKELRRFMEEAMRQSMKGMLAFTRDRNISFSQISILMHLYYKGKSSVSDIAEKLGTTNAAASQLIKKLEQEHLVKRYEGAPDRRVRQIELEKSGRKFVEAMIETRFHWLDDISLQIEDERVDQILGSIRGLAEAMRLVE